MLEKIEAALDSRPARAFLAATAVLLFVLAFAFAIVLKPLAPDAPNEEGLFVALLLMAALLASQAFLYRNLRATLRERTE